MAVFLDGSRIAQELTLIWASWNWVLDLPQSWVSNFIFLISMFYVLFCKMRKIIYITIGWYWGWGSIKCLVHFLVQPKKSTCAPSCYPISSAYLLLWCCAFHRSHFLPSYLLSSLHKWWILREAFSNQLIKNSPSPGRVLNWLEHLPHTPKLWVQSPIRAHTRINPLMHE